jgi:hypothetical protein
MSESHRDAKKADSETTTEVEEAGLPDEPMEDEEKILAGRPDVNMPALLTKDVHGG